MRQEQERSSQVEGSKAGVRKERQYEQEPRE